MIILTILACMIPGIVMLKISSKEDIFNDNSDLFK